MDLEQVNRIRDIVLYSSMSFTAALLLQFYQSKAQFFYIVELKLDPVLYSVAIAIWAVYNSINDPLFGWLMDKYPTRWGRRIPWMLVWALPLCLSFGLIWSVPSSTQGGIFLWLVIGLLLFDTGFTIVILAWAALFPEMYTDSAERSTVSAMRQVFSIIALVVALVVPPFFVNDGDLRSYAIFGWALALISLINIGLSLLGCKEPSQVTGTESYTLKEAVDILRSNKNFQAFLVINMITYFAYGQLLAMFPFYRKFVLGRDEGFETLAYALTLLVTVLSLFLWVKYTNKGTPKRTFITSSIAFSVFLLPLVVSTNLPIVLISMAALGVGLGGLLMIVDLLLAEVVDEDTLKSGNRREGIYFGLNGFFIRLAILMQAVSLSVVSTLTGFDQYRATQTDLGKFGVKIQMLVLPIITLAIGIGIIWKYYHISRPENMA